MLVGSRLVILDFGLARPILKHGDSSLTRSGMLMGTLDWMAPEQFSASTTSEATCIGGPHPAASPEGKPEETESGGLAGALRRATGDTDFQKLFPQT